MSRRLRPVVAAALVAILAQDWAAAASTPRSAGPPLRLVADVPMPGAAVRFDYQSLDPASGHPLLRIMEVPSARR